jgi:hypothetical protein
MTFGIAFYQSIIFLRHTPVLEIRITLTRNRIRIRIKVKKSDPIRISIKVISWIRIRVKSNLDPKLWFFVYPRQVRGFHLNKEDRDSPKTIPKPDPALWKEKKVQIQYDSFVQREVGLSAATSQQRQVVSVTSFESFLI